MRGDENSNPKVMFVLSAAFGELFNAMYMAMGCGFRIAIAMPEPQYSLNRDTLPGATHHFAGLNDLINAIQREEPDLVCLFSGYLYVSEKLIDFDQLDQLIKYLGSRGIKTITSDPFLGLISRLPPLDLDNPIGQILGLPIRLFGEALLGPMFPYFLKTRNILKDTRHTYIVDPNEPGVAARPFYNPNIRRWSELTASSPRTVADGPAEPYWLFVLGASDYFPQVKRDGADRVHALLAEKLIETMREGRRAALMAPAACIDSLERNTSLKECDFIRICTYDRFMAVLMRAEYAFYWNIFSASIIARLLNRLPTFFFATGHLADENQLMFEKGKSQYYRNAAPTLLPPQDPLRITSLSDLASTQDARLFAPFFETVRHLPTSQTLVRNLLAEHSLS